MWFIKFWWRLVNGKKKMFSSTLYKLVLYISIIKALKANDEKAFCDYNGLSNVWISKDYFCSD